MGIADAVAIIRRFARACDGPARSAIGAALKLMIPTFRDGLFEAETVIVGSYDVTARRDK